RRVRPAAAVVRRRFEHIRPRDLLQAAQLRGARRRGGLEDVRVRAGVLQQAARAVARRPQADAALEDVAEAAAQRGPGERRQPERRNHLEHEMVAGTGEIAEHGRSLAAFSTPLLGTPIGLESNAPFLPRVPVSCLKERVCGSVLCHLFDCKRDMPFFAKSRPLHTRGSGRSSRYAVPLAAASSRSSCSPNGNVVISSNSSCWPGSTCRGSVPFSRKLPFSTGTLKALTRLALSFDCVIPFTFGPKRACRTSKSLIPANAAFASNRITSG